MLLLLLLLHLPATAAEDGLAWLCDSLDARTGDCVVSKPRCVTHFAGGGACGGSCSDTPPFAPHAVRDCSFGGGGALRLGPNASLSCAFAAQLPSSGACNLTLAFAGGVSLAPNSSITAATVTIRSPEAAVVVEHGASISAAGLGRCASSIDPLYWTSWQTVQQIAEERVRARYRSVWYEECEGRPSVLWFDNGADFDAFASADSSIAGWPPNGALDIGVMGTISSDTIAVRAARLTLAGKLQAPRQRAAASRDARV
ncbi:hypothetical protein EMIHUDRAFT_235194 [Emiliania huxleyi CCMP1516]|uniref:Uncharacterized protein n=2 Tax=Emiliania huxleyi TaxID=2903 RepID=A0A0D3JX72_EMIH1|nr:hypothetical protein EMIHUDRAFT_235194 [Emiliania huxleyi CCMP1516]EOD28107.1 hypothetical protein EMIHUDRAFT_235194 [Emiliania huxleyi CCMP1516]|eukprot:XP_005780536.1 hypothetical protein EMIHUDRAFT_235194 [Emiliania huxleyi CCMP1516]